MTTTTRPESLAAAVCEVMRRVTYVKQTGRNQNQRYNYASDEDLCVALQQVMAEVGLCLIPHQVEGSTTKHGESRQNQMQWRTQLVVTYKLLHTSGEEQLVQVPGCGIDAQDKGPYKAMTGALKYALRQIFLLPTGNNPEATQSPPARHPDARRAHRRH